MITITRTSPTGLAALALIGTVQASKIPGFIAAQWQVSGLVAGVSGSLTRLFVLNY